MSPEGSAERIGAVMTTLIDESTLSRLAAARAANMSRPALRRRLTGALPFTIDELVELLHAIDPNLHPSDVVARAEGWMDRRRLVGALADKYDVDAVVVNTLAWRLSDAAPTRFRTYNKQRWNDRGQEIGPELWVHQDSVPMLCMLIEGVRAVLDQTLSVQRSVVSA